MLIGIFLFITISNGFQDFKALAFKDQMKVESFSFSQNDVIMVVSQGFSNERGMLVPLPHLIYKKGINGYELIGKEGYENGQLAAYESYRVVDKIQINREGTLFVSGHEDHSVRVFQIKEGMVSQIQKIKMSNTNELLRTVRLAYQGNFVLINNAIYKWTGEKFVQHCTFPYYYVAFNPSGKFIIGGSGSQLKILKNIGKSDETIATLSVLTARQSFFRDLYVGSEDQEKFIIIIPVAQNTNIYQLLFYEYIYSSNQLTFQQSINLPIENLEQIYFTKNAKFLGYSNKQGLSFQIYERKSGKYELVNKFWNFTQGISAIYINEQFTLAAVANKYLSQPGSQRYSKTSEQITFFYKCNVADCERCSWSGICSQCRSAFTLTAGKCLSSSQYSKQLSEQFFPEVRKNEQSDKTVDVFQGINMLLMLLTFVLIILLIAIYFGLRCCKRVCNYCGWSCILLQITKKDKDLNEEETNTEIEIHQKRNKMAKQMENAS